ncbi:hypothetical protein [Streptacidiphilus jiangxiensis]|uniref:Uncharacterized protein n=1 Tax=Streptacidiphilus jiangxiensis TaxID=235985 RepID=A0A1H8BI20_STRJI|nr:hypothetical protein [Streptacidiphilus jiangxiensis]SEM82541.1 hypothetical protein SAMN05414137_1676 [Streptacidiphilus jiangxiensis]
MNPDRAWMRISISGHPGYARMHTSTNDNLDRGYPSEDAAWTHELRPTEHHPDALARAREHAGASRTGVSGIEVEVYVNGQRV